MKHRAHALPLQTPSILFGASKHRLQAVWRTTAARDLHHAAPRNPPSWLGSWARTLIPTGRVGRLWRMQVLRAFIIMVG
jgi:hypothetical protein